MCGKMAFKTPGVTEPQLDYKKMPAATSGYTSCQQGFSLTFRASSAREPDRFSSQFGRRLRIARDGLSTISFRSPRRSAKMGAVDSLVQEDPTSSVSRWRMSWRIGIESKNSWSHQTMGLKLTLLRLTKTWRAFTISEGNVFQGGALRDVCPWIP